MHAQNVQSAVEPVPPASAPARAASSEARAPRVLIVDDNEINRRVLAGMLRKERYTLLSAADGEEALAMAHAMPPDLILLDIMMPGRDGYAVCGALKDNPRTEQVSVIFLSALSEPADKIRGLELGAVDYITKPFDQGEVLARVRSQLKIQRLTSAVLRANRDLREKQARLDEDLKAAGAIQRSLIPDRPPASANVDLAWRFVPCGRVGGDLFTFVPLGPDTLGVFVIDVSGHGVPAAMVTVSLSQFLSPQAGHLVETVDGAVRPAAPGEVLRRLEAEYPLERFDKYFTIAYAVIDHRTGRFRYSLGGHPQPIVLRTDGTLEMLEAGGPLIGLGMGMPFDEAEVQLGPGDRVFLYTDGLVELAAPDGTAFGEDRLLQAVHRMRRVPLDDACQRLLELALQFGDGSEPPDDITLLAVELTAATAASGEVAA
jgi:sigma-B regulation protein RsbU (phosphoserine phosphatase)